jgi:predicted permease
MGFLSEWLRRCLYLIRRRRCERELRREMESHRAMMDAPERFGNVLRLQEESRDVWGWNWLDALWRDAVYAVRSLVRSPGFTVTALLILTLGIGLNLTFFQILNLALLRPLPVRNPNSLVRFDRMWRSPTTDSISSVVPFPAIQFLRQNTTVLASVLIQTTDPGLVWGADATDRVRGAFVSANWFDELGYGPVMGRLLHQDRDDSPDDARAVVLGEEFWSARLGRDPDIVGKMVSVNDRPATVIGIAPRGFNGLRIQSDIKIWLPITQIDYFVPGSKFKADWSAGGAEVFARLRPGVSPAAAKESLRAAMSELAIQHPNDFYAGEWLEPYSGNVYFNRPSERQTRWRIAFLVVGLGVLVLLIACANLSSIVLSRSMNRVRELSLRTALGASGRRLASHLLGESALLTIAGAALGNVVGFWALKLFASFSDAASWLRWTPDWNTSIATFVIAVFAMAAVGLIPAFKIMRKRQGLAAAIKDGGQQTSAALQRTRWRQVLIAIQVTGSCVLLVLAGVLVRSFAHVVAEPGFEFRNMAVLNVYLNRFGAGPEEARSYWTSVKAAMASIPEVDAASLVSTAPLGNYATTSRFGEARDLEVTIERIEPDFFRATGIPVLAGRTFNASDDPEVHVIISKRLALRMYNTLDVIGKGFPKNKPEWTVVGVAGDTRLIQLERLNDAQLYFPLNHDRLPAASMIIRARTNPEAVLSPIRQIARATNSKILPDAHVLTKDFNDKTQTHRRASLIAVSLACSALALACLGIFGLLSYAAGMRTKEIGVRMALGAKRRSILTLVSSQLMWPVVAGLACGLAGGALISKVMETQALFLKSADVLLLGVVAGVFLAAASAAAVLPAVRAMRTDILQALRHE